MEGLTKNDHTEVTKGIFAQHPFHLNKPSHSAGDFPEGELFGGKYCIFFFFAVLYLTLQLTILQPWGEYESTTTASENKTKKTTNKLLG